MNLIGLLGQSGVGKDTVGDYLHAKGNIVTMGLADEIKRISQKVFLLSDEQVWGSWKNEPDQRYRRPCNTCGMGINTKCENHVPYLIPREIYQLLGTEWGRRCYQDIWADLVVRQAGSVLFHGYSYNRKIGLQKSFHQPATPNIWVVVTDMRFKNEMETIKSAGGIVVRIYRPGYDGRVGLSNHASETEQRMLQDDQFDLILNNDSSLEVLHAKVDAELLPLMRKKEMSA